MTRLKFSVCCVLVVALSCKKDATFTETMPPQAAVHWVHAVPDTGEMDMRPVDIITNAGLFDALFRGSNMFYQGIDAGTHQIRVFLSSINPGVTGTPIIDTSVTLASPNSYTLIHTGFARTGSSPGRLLWVVPDAGADPGANNVGIRVVNAGAGMPNVDVYVTRTAAAPLPATPAVANLAYLGVGTYLTMARDSVAADSLRLVVTAAGTTTPVLFTVKVPRGVPGTTSNNPIAGGFVAGSVVTAVIVPASVAGSTAPQGGAFAAPSAVFLVDKRPPDTIPIP